MATNFGPTAFQSNAFQTHPLAFQIDIFGDAAEQTGGVSAQTPQTDGVFTAQGAKSSAWTKGAAPSNTYQPASAPGNSWSPIDEPNPTP
jgi:hypothetical protein